MSKNRAKRYLLIGSILGILICTFGCVNIAKNSSEKLPIRTLSIQLDEDRREELFAQLQKFSEKHNFEFHLSFYDNKKVFFVEMYGKDLEILALSKPVNATALDINFYEKDPTKSSPQDVVDKLFIDLNSFIRTIPSVKISDK